MAKDKFARREGRVTTMALANLIATIVDTMRDADMPNDIVHLFLDKLDRLNAMTLFGDAGCVLADVVGIIRDTVPDND